MIARQEWLYEVAKAAGRFAFCRGYRNEPQYVGVLTAWARADVELWGAAARVYNRKALAYSRSMAFPIRVMYSCNGHVFDPEKCSWRCYGSGRPNGGLE